MDQKQQILHHYRVDRKTVLRKACFPQMKDRVFCSAQKMFKK